MVTKKNLAVSRVTVVTATPSCTEATEPIYGIAQRADG